jgi:hypothetical protein
MKKCKLCLKDKQLIKKSHILSEFLHAELFDENHKLIKFDAIELGKGNDEISRPSSGSYEGQLLCDKCDNQQIGKFETYISNVLKDNLKKENKLKCSKTTNPQGLSFIKIENLDYLKTKLFLLSLLWRAGISTRDEYKEVQLGPYSEKIRKLIIDDNSSTDTDIQISVLKFENGSDFTTFIGQPRRHKSGHFTNYSIIINGYLIIFHLGKDKLAKMAFNDRLKENGELTLMEIPKDKINEFVLKYTGTIK